MTESSDQEGQEPKRPKQAEQPPTAQLLNLDAGRRLVPAQTVRSEIYIELRDRLCAADRQRLETMEEMLFAERPRASACKPGPLHLPDAEFECIEGTIWFFFSAGERKFVLSAFRLNKPGGKMMPTPDERADYQACRWVANSWGTGIAAHLRAMIHPHSPGIDGSWIGLTPGASVLLVGTGGFHEGNLPRLYDSVLLDIAKSCRNMVYHDAEPSLPAWSLLGRFFKTREEIENPYARAIFAGEALCRIGVEIGHGGGHQRALRWGPIPKTLGSAWCRQPAEHLGQQGVAILDAVLERGVTRKIGSDTYHFFTASFMDHDMMADVRRLALIRNELVFRLAMLVSIQATVPLPIEADEAKLRARDLLRRYALLSEFVHLSEAYFGAGEVEASMDVVEDLALCEQKYRPTLNLIIRDLFEFGNSSRVIVDELLVGADGTETANAPALHRRLVEITTELVAP